MSLIVAEGLSKSWSDKDVLRNVHLSLAPRERVALVGPNGEGKTTLIRILAGLEPATSGTIQRKAGLRVGYLPQDPPALAGTTLRQVMLDVFADLHRMERELHGLAHQMESEGDPKLIARYGQLQHEFEARGGYSYHRRIEQVLTGLEFPTEMWDRPLSTFSGGQRTRGYLARLLLEGPDVLLLDEPTNHLDISSVEWLEGWLADYAGAAVVVSHDRYFLDRATTRTWEIAFASLECYKGAYSDYVRQRQERFVERMRRWEAQQEYVRETEEFIRRFLAGQRSKEAQGRRTRLERFLKEEAIDRPREHPRITVRLKAAQRSGDQALRIQDLRAGYEKGKCLVEAEKLDVTRGQRVAIVGPNGCGKTTFLRTVLGQLPSLGGSAKLGANVQIGYLSQTHAELKGQWSAVEAVRQADPGVSEERARNLLGSLLLDGDHAFKRVAELSGGQRSRVVLARLILQQANLLVLDEPTNHLDILSQEVLQDVLADFDGTILFVSHDRYLIQALATHLWAIHEGQVHPLRGNWDSYLQWRRERLGLADAEAADVAAEQARQGRIEDYRERRRRTNELQRLQRRLAQVEQDVHKLEQRLRELTDLIGWAGESGDVDLVTSLGEEYAQADQRVRELMEEWEKLSEEIQH